jgi:hypothetical protein
MIIRIQQVIHFCSKTVHEQFDPIKKKQQINKIRPLLI